MNDKKRYYDAAIAIVKTKSKSNIKFSIEVDKALSDNKTICPELCSKLIEVNEGLKLYAPDPALVQETYKDLLSKDDTILFPFWAQVWPSAHALASFLLEEKEWIDRKRCLELGAGIGLPSFSIAQYADTIMVSDYALEAVELMEERMPI